MCPDRDDQLMDADEREHVAALCKGLAHPTRIAVLEGFARDQSVQAIADDLGVTRGTLQDHLNMLVRAELIYRPDEADATYALTPIGRYTVTLLEDHGPDIAAAYSQLAAVEEDAEAEFDSVEELPLDETAVEKAIHTRKWELAMDEITSLGDQA